MNTPPRLFISYSWSTPEHEQWVLDLATELVNSGIDVVLDKWALREGHDSVAFMEKMVTDATITKVILVCDQAYAMKADNRASGVGTETQIISAEVYARQDQDKFVAVIAEKDETGKPFLPAYYKSRVYVDLSESNRYSENLEKLLRWIFDKPLYIRPELGQPPSFVIDPETPILGTSALSKRFIEGVRTDKAYSMGAFEEYLLTYSENLERFRVTKSDNEQFDDRVIRSIEDFTPSRNEFIQTLTALSQYADAPAYASRLQRFFESLIPYLSHPPQIRQWDENEFDNFRFIIHELYLYTLAILLRTEHFKTATYLLSQAYLTPDNSEYRRGSTLSYTALRESTQSIEVRNRRLELNRLSLRADLLENRAKTSGVLFRHIMQADFVCFLRAELAHSDPFERWWPETLVYSSRQSRPFDIFIRSASKSYLLQTLPLLGVTDLMTIKTKLEEYATYPHMLPRWQFNSFQPSALLGFDQLGSRA
jgi:hypothetical protein